MSFPSPAVLTMIVWTCLSFTLMADPALADPKQEKALIEQFEKQELRLGDEDLNRIERIEALQKLRLIESAMEVIAQSDTRFAQRDDHFKSVFGEIGLLIDRGAQALGVDLATLPREPGEPIPTKPREPVEPVFTDEEQQRVDSLNEELLDLNRMHEEGALPSDTHRAKVKSFQDELRKIREQAVARSKREETGDDAKDVVKTIKVSPGGTIRGTRDGEVAETKAPEDWIPWPLKNWPDNARAMHDKRLYKRMQIVEENPTQWARDMNRKLANQQGQRKLYVKIVREWYQQDLKKPWHVIAEEDPVARDVERFTRGWATNTEFVNDLKVKVVGRHRPEPVTKPVTWYWLEIDLHITRVQREYEDAQKKLRRQLLTTQDVASDWDGIVRRFANEIVRAERRMIWLLGYNDVATIKALEQAENIRENLLPLAQEEVIRDFVLEKWFKLMLAGTWPFRGGGHQEQYKSTRTVKSLEDLVSKSEERLETTEKKVTKLIKDMEIESRETVMRRGILKVLEGQLFPIHKTDNTDKWYDDLLEDRNIPGFEVTALMQTSVYREFLLTEREKEVFEKNRQGRAPDTPRAPD